MSKYNLLANLILFKFYCILRIEKKSNYLKSEINQIIKECRLELNLTLNDVSKALRVADSTVLRYESKDIQNMGIDKVEALSKVLKCDPAYLMGWQKTPL